VENEYNLLEESSFPENIKTTSNGENDIDTYDISRIKSCGGTSMSNGRYRGSFNAKVLRGTATSKRCRTRLIAAESTLWEASKYDI
jgi:hypothetical protein